MENNNEKSLDILGIKPIAKCVEHASKETINGGKNFLSKICMPAAEEYGLLLQDKVKHWRASNAQKVLEKTEKKLLEQNGYQNKKAHPLITWRIIENSSWAEHDELQEIWAGLLASTCSEDGKDDSNLVFIALISQLSEIQIRILNYAVINAELIIHEHNLVTANELSISLEELFKITSIEDINRLDRELDHLASIDLIGGNLLSGGFHIDKSGKIDKINISPHALGIQLYVRCQGYIGTPKEYFNL